MFAERRVAKAERRIAKEKADLRHLPSDIGFTASQREEGDVFHWKALVDGLAGTPYEGGTWELDVLFTDAYPCKPPKIKFVTRIFHCNIAFKSGAISMEMLTGLWSPAYTLEKVLLCVQSLMTEPNASRAPKSVAAKMMQRDRDSYDAMARKCTALHALRDDGTRPVPSLFAFAALRLPSLRHVPESLFSAVNAERVSLGGVPLLWKALVCRVARFNCCQMPQDAMARKVRALMLREKLAHAAGNAEEKDKWFSIDAAQLEPNVAFLERCAALRHGGFVSHFTSVSSLGRIIAKRDDEKRKRALNEYVRIALQFTHTGMRPRKKLREEAPRNAEPNAAPQRRTRSHGPQSHRAAP